MSSLLEKMLYDPSFGYLLFGLPIAFVVIPVMSYKALAKQRAPMWLRVAGASLMMLLSVGLFFMLISIFT